jgi:uncharacterized membrane protein
MVSVSIGELPVVLAQAVAHAKFYPNANSGSELAEFFLRWLHYVAGITWIGLLYFFNFVNGSFMKALDGPTKEKVTPQLMPRALWWFRWGSVITVLAGIGIFSIRLTHDQQMGLVFGRWFGIVLVTFVILFGVQRMSWAVGKGWILAAIVTLVVAAMAVIMLLTSGGGDSVRQELAPFAYDNHALAISIGGGLGVLMFLNVWGIIWPHQKRLIAWTADKAEKGTAIPAEAAVLTRRAFLASRMNTWLSIPMLFFMTAASHAAFFGK